MTNFGAASGAEKMVTGSVARAGKKAYSVTLKFMDVGTLEIQASVSAPCEGPARRLPDCVARLGKRLLSQLIQ